MFRPIAQKPLRQGSIPPTIFQLGAPPKLHPTLLLETTETNAKLSDIKNIEGVKNSHIKMMLVKLTLARV